MEKDSKCYKCGIGFPQIGDVKSEERVREHEVIHHGLLCKECNRFFVSSVHLKYHLTFNHDTKCNDCLSYCEQSCAEKYALGAEAAGKEKMKRGLAEKKEATKGAEEELKRMLRLCSREQVSADEIHSIRSVRIRSQVSALPILGKNVFSPGTEIEITLDTTSAFLAFSEVLNSFFQQFCSFDRYIQLSVNVYGKDGYVKRYPKLHGSQKAL